MSQPIAVFGAGGHGKVVVDALVACDAPPMGVFDDEVRLHGTSVLGHTVVGGREELLARCTDEWSVVIAIARNEVRHRLARALAAAAVRLRGVRHPSAIVSRYAEVAETAQLMAGAIVGAGAQIGEHAIVNTGAIVEHDCRAAPFSHIGPGARLAGAVHVGEGVLVGTGASAIPFCHIGSWATVGAGAVVVCDVSEGVTVVGVPAREAVEERP